MSNSRCNLNIGTHDHSTLPVVGTRVDYRHWNNQPWRTGTIVRYWIGCDLTVSVDIARDGYRETSVHDIEDLFDPDLITGPTFGPVER